MFSICTRPLATLAFFSPLTLKLAAGFSFIEVAQEGYKAVHDGLVASGVLPPEPATWEEVGAVGNPEQAKELQQQLRLQQMQQQQLQQQDLQQRQLQLQLQRQEQQLQQEQLQRQTQHQFQQSPLQPMMVEQAPQQLQQQQQVQMQQRWPGQFRPSPSRRKSLVAMRASGDGTLAASPAPATAGVIQRPKGWDQCMHFARYVKSKQVTGPELVRTWKGTCEPAVQSGRATERYRLMCNSLGGAVEPFASQVDYNVEQLCDTVLVLFHELTAADSAAR